MIRYIKTVAAIVQGIFAVVGLGFFSILVPEIIRVQGARAGSELQEDYLIAAFAAIIVIGGIGLTEVVKRRLIRGS